MERFRPLTPSLWPSPAGQGAGGAPARHLRTRDELYAIWGAARAESNLAYDEWREMRTREAYAVYRAAEDRADAAQDMLACVPPGHGVPEAA